jgi:hypothetical protein
MTSLGRNNYSRRAVAIHFCAFMERFAEPMLVGIFYGWVANRSALTTSFAFTNNRAYLLLPDLIEAKSDGAVRSIFFRSCRIALAGSVGCSSMRFSAAVETVFVWLVVGGCESGVRTG